ERDTGLGRLFEQGQGRGGVGIRFLGGVRQQVRRPLRALGAQRVEELVLVVLEGPLQPSGQRLHDGRDELVPPDGERVALLGRTVFAGLARFLPTRVSRRGDLGSGCPAGALAGSLVTGE